ncbi:hypothetical protein DFH06DRAFT_1292672 [Mycena polygramma]|nr:hypothetical protein DFH06DRAFT_1292672 [Mycena polygramma]
MTVTTASTCFDKPFHLNASCSGLSPDRYFVLYGGIKGSTGQPLKEIKEWNLRTLKPMDSHEGTFKAEVIAVITIEENGLKIEWQSNYRPMLNPLPTLTEETETPPPGYTECPRPKNSGVLPPAPENSGVLHMPRTSELRNRGCSAKDLRCLFKVNREGKGWKIETILQDLFEKPAVECAKEDLNNILLVADAIRKKEHLDWGLMKEAHQETFAKRWLLSQ